VAVQGCGDLRKRFATTLGAAVYEGLEWLLSAFSTAVLTKSGAETWRKKRWRDGTRLKKYMGSDDSLFCTCNAVPRHPRS
jgi:hypothetical protein